MDRLDVFISMLSDTLNTKTKRHMVGGILLSVSMLFGGLALTVITVKSEEDLDEQYIE
jgi:hypothetical protein